MHVYKPKPPYPGRLVRKNDSEQYSRFLDMLKKLHVNISFIEALSNMPKHAKFLKYLLTNKKKLEELSTVDKFIFPVDFVILDMDEDSNVPLILGCPFLATARALIDVANGKLTLRVHDDIVTFDVQKSMRHTQQ
ncbi:uncharacterized protein LOC143570983 [Bidens hawaiensis]|uniref:uncharacterized protein LOC143570983 n=1 Tax=Bidens hawaiensis TaxID=980011 RepID=UPI00404B32E4